MLIKFKQSGMSWGVREIFYRHLSTQISNGVPIEQALASFKNRLLRRNKPKIASAITDISRRMRDGQSLAQALKKWIPSDEFGVISAGELSGSLPRSLDLIIESKRRIDRVYSAIKSALVSPVMYMFITFGMVWAIGKYVTPGLESTLPKERAHGLVSALYWMGDMATSWWALVPLAGLVVAIAAIIYSLPVWTGRGRIQAENYFPYNFYRDINGYLWLMSFTQLLRAGMPDTNILERQQKEGAPWLKERLKTIWFRMDNGNDLPAALLAKGKAGLPAFGFPNPDIVDDIESMAGFPDFPDKISVLATQWAVELERTTLARAKSFGMLAEMAMYLLMGFLMMAVNDLSSQLSNAVH